MMKLSQAMAAAVIAVGLSTGQAFAQASGGGVKIEQAWSRATPGGAKVAAGYMTITNTGSAPDKLIGGSSPIAGKIEIHEMAMKDNVMTMRPIAGGLPIEPGKSVKLAPGGYHVMFMDLKSPLKQGGKFKATLEFEKAGKIEVPFDVQGVGAQQPAMPGMGGHKM